MTDRMTLLRIYGFKSAILNLFPATSITKTLENSKLY